jgi:predicted nucleic acid-binding protein
LEYESIALRMSDELQIDAPGIVELVGYLCSIAEEVKIHFLWRPLLPDPKDDMVLELAVAGRSDCVVTFNAKDFRCADQFGVSVFSPREFLEVLGELR